MTWRRPFKRPPLTADRARRLAALHAIGVAIDTGFTLKVNGEDALDVTAPLGVPEKICDAIAAVLFEHEREVLRFLEFLAFETRRGRHWRPAARGLPQ
jgi:hypothetical protein